MYKINIKISCFLCTNNDLSEKEIKDTIPFMIVLKTMKVLGINLTKEMKDLYIEDYKTLIKEVDKLNENI